jgi:3-oxoadipate enol-lactonase
VVARDAGWTPDLPHGAAMLLPGRGTTFVRTVSGPVGAPTVVLLHGWTATADLNWFTCYEALGEHFRVVALDHRGHGRGIRSRKAFRLEDCADDAVAVCDVLGIEQFIPVG